MRVERLSTHQFTIFLTFDDLVERGFANHEMWHDAQSIQELFSEMMYDASDELDIELDGTLHVHVFMMQAQGMHIVVTQVNEDSEDDDFIEMKVTLDESNEMIFCFDDFENLIAVASYLAPQGITNGQVYYLEGNYYILFEEEDILDLERDAIIAMMSEYAYSSIITSHRLKEYGKVIYEHAAIHQLIRQFYQ